MSEGHTTLEGLSLIGSATAKPGGETFEARSPLDGKSLQTSFHSATAADLDAAAKLALQSAPVYAALSGKARAAFLRQIADELTASGEVLVDRAHAETGLPLPRLQGELGRTTGQLRMFAALLEEGSWVDATIDEAMPDRKPLPKPDLRSMLRPLGAVAVFGASNFPLAFSVAGGDTASALAAGNPVIVKAHPAHPGTSELAGRAIQRAASLTSMPEGVFSLLFDSGIEVGVALVQHPAIKAVAFTGSQGGGKALMKLAAARPEPIPCYAEMGSTNPLFILPGALRERSAALAQGLQTSFTLGSGQFCTKPGVVFLPQRGSDEFISKLQSGVSGLTAQGMLTHGIAERYTAAIQARIASGGAEMLTGQQAVNEADAAATTPALFSVTLDKFLEHPELGEEIFGPTTLLVSYGSIDELVASAERLHGHLTATIQGTDDDLQSALPLLRVLETKVGRILFNGFPTGVEVTHAMVHGGPFPATSDGRSTSVGTQANLRFVRPVCFQDFPDAVLPTQLQRSNPEGIMRLVNGSLTRDPQP